MATATLSATLNPPISEPRLSPMERMLVIENHGALGEILRQLFSSEGYEVDVVPDAVCGLQKLRQKAPAAVILGRFMGEVYPHQPPVPVQSDPPPKSMIRTTYVSLPSDS